MHLSSDTHRVLRQTTISLSSGVSQCARYPIWSASLDPHVGQRRQAATATSTDNAAENDKDDIGNRTENVPRIQYQQASERGWRAVLAARRMKHIASDLHFDEAQRTMVDRAKARFPGFNPTPMSAAAERKRGKDRAREWKLRVTPDESPMQHKSTLRARRRHRLRETVEQEVASKIKKYSVASRFENELEEKDQAQTTHEHISRAYFTGLDITPSTPKIKRRSLRAARVRKHHVQGRPDQKLREGQRIQLTPNKGTDEEVQPEARLSEPQYTPELSTKNSRTSQLKIRKHGRNHVRWHNSTPVPTRFQNVGEPIPKLENLDEKPLTLTHPRLDSFLIDDFKPILKMLCDATPQKSVGVEVSMLNLDNENWMAQGSDSSNNLDGVGNLIDDITYAPLPEAASVRAVWHGPLAGKTGLALQPRPDTWTPHSLALYLRRLIGAGVQTANKSTQPKHRTSAASTEILQLLQDEQLLPQVTSSTLNFAISYLSRQEEYQAIFRIFYNLQKTSYKFNSLNMSVFLYNAAWEKSSIHFKPVLEHMLGLGLKPTGNTWFTFYQLISRKYPGKRREVLSAMERTGIINEGQTVKEGLMRSLGWIENTMVSKSGILVEVTQPSKETSDDFNSEMKKFESRGKQRWVRRFWEQPRKSLLPSRSGRKMKRLRVNTK